MPNDAPARADLARAREYAVHEVFGGPSTLALLEQRNPELRLILNAGIVAGVRLAERSR